MARRSVITNFPVASTVKSVHSPRTTAALPSPKCARSAFPAATSQSGADSARLIDRSVGQNNSSMPRSTQPAAAKLLRTEDHNLLVLFGDLLEKFLGIQVLDV